jgi:hypothetical protein
MVVNPPASGTSRRNGLGNVVAVLASLEAEAEAGMMKVLLSLVCEIKVKTEALDVGVGVGVVEDGVRYVDRLEVVDDTELELNSLNSVHVDFQQIR